MKRKNVFLVIAILAILAVTYPVTWSVYAGTLNNPNHFSCPPLIPCDNSPLSSATCSGYCIVVIQNALFTPGNLTITPGTTVEWINMDPTTHTATCYSSSGSSNSSACFNEPSDPAFILPNTSYTVTFPEHSGVFYYQCTIHNQMQGEINIAAQ